MDTPTASKNRFGPRVLGQEVWERQVEEQKADTTGGVRLGSRIMGDGDDAKPAVETPVTPPPTGTDPPAGETKPRSQGPNPFRGETLPTIAETEEILAARPELYDDAFAAEALADEPRTGVLKVLLRIERDRPTPRDNVMKLLEAGLGA
jgi:hypothetical protein